MNIPFSDLTLRYAPLPANFPIQPLSAQEYQPSAYTEANGQDSFVTIILPLPGAMAITLPDALKVSVAEDTTSYGFYIALSHDDKLDNKGRLAMISFSVSFPDTIPNDGKWEINVSSFLAAASLRGAFSDQPGKVVMDSNIMPACAPHII